MALVSWLTKASLGKDVGNSSYWCLDHGEYRANLLRPWEVKNCFTSVILMNGGNV